MVANALVDSRAECNFLISINGIDFLEEGRG